MSNVGANPVEAFAELEAHMRGEIVDRYDIPGEAVAEMLLRSQTESLMCLVHSGPVPS